MAPATVVVACIACFFNPVLDDGETCSPFLAGPRLSNHNCNHCNIPGFLCSCFPALTFVWVATPRSCARLPCSLVICWRNRINCTASIFVAACTPSAYVLTDTEKTGIQKVYIQLGFLLWISLAEAKQWISCEQGVWDQRGYMLKQQKSIPHSQFLLSSLSLQRVSSPVIMMDKARISWKWIIKLVISVFTLKTIFADPFLVAKDTFVVHHFAVFPSLLSMFWRGFQLSVPLIAMIQPLVRFLSEKQTIDQQSQ